MATNIALLLSLVGWWYLIRHRRLEGEKIGLALAIALIWILIDLSRPVSLWFQSSWSVDSDQVASIEEGNPINRTIALALLVFGVLILLKRNVNIGEFISANQWLVCLYAFCLVSLIWSDMPFVVFKRWFRHLGAILFVLVLLTDRRGFRAVITVFRYVAYILLPASLVLIKYYPQLGRHYHGHFGELMLTGVTMSKNHLGALCMISALFLLVEIHQQWISGNRRSFITRGDLCLFVVAIWLLHKSHSATALLAFIAGAVTYWALGLKQLRRARTPWMFSLVLVFTLIIPLGFYGVGLTGADSTLGSFVDLTGHSETFWGRTVLWKDVIDMVSNPFLGFGYESFWLGERLEKLWELYWWKPTEAHNGFVGVYASLGLVGVTILIGVIIQSYRRLFRLFVQDNADEYPRIGLAFLTAALLYNVTEYSFLGLTSMWLIILLVSTKVSSAPLEASDALETSPRAPELEPV
jgi:exopolysaccharide production protein ExoQ